MDVANSRQWKEIIESIINSEALKKFNENFNNFIILNKQYEQQLEELVEQKQKLIDQSNDKLLTIPLISLLIKYWIDFKISNYNQKIQKLKHNHNSIIRKPWYLVWKEILKFYNCDKESINSEHFRNWQDKFIFNCQSLINDWKQKKANAISFLLSIDNNIENFKLLFKNYENKNEDDLLKICQSLIKNLIGQEKLNENYYLVEEIFNYCFLIINGEKLCDIVKTLVSDICSDLEFQKITSLNITGDSQFLRANIFFENETDWNKNFPVTSKQVVSL